jgi:hypothetical protein
MKIHSDALAPADILEILKDLQESGDIDKNVFPVVFGFSKSRSHRYAVEIQLGTHVRTTEPKRGYKTKDSHTGENIYAATYEEWGLFLADIFNRDYSAKCGIYKNQDDFQVKTNYRF